MHLSFLLFLLFILLLLSFWRSWSIYFETGGLHLNRSNGKLQFDGKDYKDYS